MAVELLPRYGEFRAGFRKRMVGEKVFGWFDPSKVSAALVAFLLLALVITLFSWLNLATGRVDFDVSTYTMRNTNGAEKDPDRSFIGRRLLGLPTHEQKKQEALNKLEDVLLEPPRAASERSRTYQRRTKYLSDLMGDDSLRSYPRRVYIEVGQEGSEGGGWFEKTYPKRGLDFEKYEIKADEEEEEKEKEDGMGMTEWMTERVKEEEFVVMKAEAEAVEELVKTKAIRLVDELFLECKTKNQNTTTNKKKKKKAYWECLALYGKLRDQGVAVHQWWG